MRLFFDFEFIEDGNTIEPISIGMVSADGREYYAEFDDVDWSTADDWVLENVKPHLTGLVQPRKRIAQEIREFVAFACQGDQSKPEFWAYFGDYDWVLLCRLYGRMIDLPSGWPMLCLDVKQMAIERGNPALPKQTGVEHHAMEDARWVRTTFHNLCHLPAIPLRLTY